MSEFCGKNAYRRQFIRDIVDCCKASECSTCPFSLESEDDNKKYSCYLREMFPYTWDYNFINEALEEYDNG